MMQAKARTKKPMEGDIFAIPLSAGAFGFAQVAKGGDYAYFDFMAGDIPNIDEITGKPIAFRLAMIGDSAKSGGWRYLGRADLKGCLASEAIYWNEPVGSNNLRLCRGSGFAPATLEDIQKLEVMAWWDEAGVTRRLLDHFAGVQNRSSAFLETVRMYDPISGQEIKEMAMHKGEALRRKLAGR